MALVLFAAPLMTACGGARSPAPLPRTQSAAPGDIVPISTPVKLAHDGAGVTVTIGGEIAPVVRVSDDRTVEVMVPVLPPGEYTAIVSAEGGKVARSQLTVTDTRSRRYRFQFEGQDLVLSSSEPCNDAATRPATTLHRRLSLDVVDAKGAVVFTTAVLHPEEVSGEGVSTSTGGKDSLSRLEPATEPFVRVILPNTGDGATIRIYDVPRGLDISTDAGRAKRALLREFPVEGRSKR